MSIHIRNFTCVFALLSVLVGPSASADEEPVCLYVGSYHQGYHWNDAIERGLESSLSGACRLERFYMDTKRNKTPAFAEQKAQEALSVINELKPDVIVACDDNASKYLVAPHLKDATLPVVFCGVNWTVDAYGYPYANVTGMVEVAPNRAVVQEAKGILKDARSFAFIAADVPTQHKEVQRLSIIAANENLALQSYLVDSLSKWQSAYQKAQEHDFVILGNPIGIADWDLAKAKEIVASDTQKLTATFGVYMRPLVVFAMSNVPEEQGEWSGQVAVSILNGKNPSDIPIVSNQKWVLYVNPSLASQLDFVLPEHILRRAVRVK